MKQDQERGDMKNFTFIIRLDSQKEMSDILLDDIYNGNCNDSLVFSIDDKVYVEFEREGRIFEESLASALDDLSKIPYLFNQMSVVDEVR